MLCLRQPMCHHFDRVLPRELAVKEGFLRVRPAGREIARAIFTPARGFLPALVLAPARRPETSAASASNRQSRLPGHSLIRYNGFESAAPAGHFG
jgi:hypothetical protein